MKIEILGVEGCLNCTMLVQETINILSRLNVAAGVEKVTGTELINKYRPAALPGFVLNGRLKASGRVPSKAEITGWIKEELGGV